MALGSVDRRGHLGDQVVQDLLDRVGAVGLPGLPLTSRILSRDLARIASTQPGSGCLISPTLSWPALLLQLLDHADDLDDRLVAELDRVGDRRLPSISRAPSSIMLTKCLVPATTRSKSLYSSCSAVGLMTNLPSIRPTRTWAIGAMNGMSLIATAARGGDAGEDVGIVLPVERQRRSGGSAPRP